VYSRRVLKLIREEIRRLEDPSRKITCHEECLSCS
jgi:hypothetical protein